MWVEAKRDLKNLNPWSLIQEIISNMRISFGYKDSFPEKSRTVWVFVQNLFVDSIGRGKISITNTECIYKC